MTNLEAIRQASAPALAQWLADGHELREEIQAELASRGMRGMPDGSLAPLFRPASARIPLTPELRCEIHEQHLEDLGTDV